MYAWRFRYDLKLSFNSGLKVLTYFITGEQEQQLRGKVGKVKRKTLKDLFKPPLDIMHKGTFETVSII